MEQEVATDTGVEIVRVERLAPAVVRVELAGRLDAQAGDKVYRDLDSQLQGQRAQHVFWDLERLQSYHSNVRIRSVEVLKAYLPVMASLHAFTTSRLAAMGVSVANLALGGIAQVHKTRASFDRSLQEAMHFEIAG